MLSPSQQTAALNFLGRVQSGVSRLQTSVHQQLSHQFDAVSSAVANATSAAITKTSSEVVVSSSGDTLRSLFVCRAPVSERKCATNLPAATIATQHTGSDLLLTAFDGVSLHIAGFLTAQELFSVQLVNRSWRQFVLVNREELFGALLQTNTFFKVIPSSSTFQSYALSLRHELENELFHTKAVQPTHSALEKYCSTTEPADHGFIAMFCDILEFTDPRVARFVGFKRHYALNVVLAATPNHVNAFRKRSDYTRPIAFVPVRNPNWPEFELPQIDFPGFMGYAFEFVRMVPGYESLKETVAKSILRDLMIFDTSEHAAAYGVSIGRQPFAAILDETLSDPSLHLTFSSPLRRTLSHLPIEERIQRIEERMRAIDACLIDMCA
ncbi:hypothetical protein Gpo141_00013164 [Globisporangium polare]